MISRPLSPSKGRSALSSKSVNVKNQGISKKSHPRMSPTKNKFEFEQALSSSPTRQVSTSPIRSPIKPRDGSQFSFFEESDEDRAAILMKHISLRRSAVHDENDYGNDRENRNFIQDKEYNSKYNKRTLLGKRNPLQDLSVELFPGTVQFRGTNVEQPLNLHLNHKTQLPAYVTPPRNGKLKDFFSSSHGREIETDNYTATTTNSFTTDDIPVDKVIRKLAFKISEDA